MTLRLVPGDLSLAILDSLDVDSVAAFVGPERPLQGLAGLVDWRLCGALSRAIREGTFVPEKGEVMLLPSGGRLPAPRVFCFGLSHGVAAAGDELPSWACQVLAKAGARSVALELPRGEPGASLARAFAVAGLKGGFACHVLLGEGRAILEDLETAARELGPDVEVAKVAHRGDGVAAASLPARGSVVR